ncbi:MAG: hypothetical protein ABEJ40_03650 [Haloarculaceae archaeon]
MSSTSPSVEATSRNERIESLIDTVSRSLSLKVAGAGVTLLVIAILINTFLAVPPAVAAETTNFDLWGLWAGILAVWGGALSILGTVTFALVWWKRQ